MQAAPGPYGPWLQTKRLRSGSIRSRPVHALDGGAPSPPGSCPPRRKRGAVSAGQLPLLVVDLSGPSLRQSAPHLGLDIELIASIDMY